MHMSSLAKEVVGERFGPNKKERSDMLGSFLHHGLTQEEAESETLVQLLVHITLLPHLLIPRKVSRLRYYCHSHSRDHASHPYCASRTVDIVS